jgi:hypothetical protein
MAGVVPSDAVIRVLNPIVKTGEYPVNQAAVKMLTKVAENKESQDVVIDHLGDIMPGLLRVIFVFSLPNTTAIPQIYSAETKFFEIK